MVESFSAPTTSTTSLCPAAIMPSATAVAYKKPGQAAEMSNAAARSAPSRACRSQAVEGSSRSGVAVASTIASMSWGVRPAWSSALTLASQLSMATDWSGRAMWRSRMPVRSTIHWSEVSSMRVRSALVSTPGGTATPTLSHFRDGSPGHAVAPCFALGELRPDVPTQIDLDRLDRHPNGVLDGICGGGPVTDDGNAFYPQQGAPPYSE